MTASSPRFMEPKYLTAAALAYAVVKNAKNDPHRVPEAIWDEDSASVVDAIPDIEDFKPTTRRSTNKKHVVPVVVKPITKRITTTPTTLRAPQPHQAKVSAAAMRQLESRRRVRTAMDQYQHSPHHKKDLTPTVTPVSSGSSVTSASVRTSPKAAASIRKSKVAPTTPRPVAGSPRTVRTAKLASFSLATGSMAPPAVVHCQPVRFKVKSSTTGTVLRFQCAPTYQSVLQNIVERLEGSSKSSMWSTASNMVLNSTSDTAKSVSIKFQDAEDDWYTLSNDDDVQEAVEAAAGRKDTMVRLTVEEHAAATRVWQSISTSFRW